MEEPGLRISFTRPPVQGFRAKVEDQKRLQQQEKKLRQNGVQGVQGHFTSSSAIFGNCFRVFPSFARMPEKLVHEFRKKIPLKGFEVTNTSSSGGSYSKGF